MRLPAYQIYKVLQQYTRRLNRLQRVQTGRGFEEKGEERSLLAAAQRREIVGQVMAAIKENVGRVCPVPKSGNRKNPLQSDSGPRAAAARLSPFVYNLIDKDHRKTTRTILVEAPGLLAKDDSERRDLSEGNGE